MRTATQPIRLIHQQINPLTPLQHSLNVLRHDVPHAIDLPLCRSQRIRRRGRIVRLQQRAELIVEGSATVSRESREVRAGGRVSGEELALDFEEEGEGNAAALFGGCNDDVAEGRVGVGFALAGVIGGAGCCG